MLNHYYKTVSMTVSLSRVTEFIGCTHTEQDFYTELQPKKML